MSKTCVFTGRVVKFGNQKTYRGKAKYLGGVGKKITGTSRRTFKPNLQRIQLVLDGEDAEPVGHAGARLRPEIAPAGGQPVEGHGRSVAAGKPAVARQRRHDGRNFMSHGPPPQQADFATLNCPGLAVPSPGRACGTHSGCEVRAA